MVSAFEFISFIFRKSKNWFQDINNPIQPKKERGITKVSEEIISKLAEDLKLSQSARQYLFALIEPDSKKPVYFLYSHRFSEKSKKDIEDVMGLLKPELLLLTVDPFILRDQYETTDFNSEGLHPSVVPQDLLSLLKDVFLSTRSTESYERILDTEVCRFILGGGFNDIVFQASNSAKENGCSLHYLLLPNTDENIEDYSEDSGNQSEKFHPVNLHKQFYKDPISSVSSAEGLKESATSTASPDLPDFASYCFSPMVDYFHQRFPEDLGNAASQVRFLLKLVEAGEPIGHEFIPDILLFRKAVETSREVHWNISKDVLSQIAETERVNLSLDEFSNLDHKERHNIAMVNAIQTKVKSSEGPVLAIVEFDQFQNLAKSWHIKAPDLDGELLGGVLISEEELFEGKFAEFGKINYPLPTNLALGLGTTVALLALRRFYLASLLKAVGLKIPFLLKSFLIVLKQKMALVGVKSALSAKATVSTKAVATASKSTFGMKIGTVKKAPAFISSAFRSAGDTFVSSTVRAVRAYGVNSSTHKKVSTIKLLAAGSFVAFCFLNRESISNTAAMIPDAAYCTRLGRGLAHMKCAEKEIGTFSM